MARDRFRWVRAVALRIRYSREFLQGAQSELKEMKNYFLMPDLELKPQVSSSEQYWIQLTMRYVVAAGRQAA